MRRKLFALALTLAAAISLAAPAMADVIWEPEDKFYEAHRDECQYEGRRYQLAGHDGHVDVFSGPKKGKVLATLDNGQMGGVQFTWSDGEYEWGYLYGVEDSEIEGWVPMDDLSLIYDSQQFMEDHAAEMSEGGPAEVDFSQAQLYQYPGGPKAEVLEEDRDYMPFDQVFTTLYTDGDGKLWGYVGYYMGRREAWVCLDEPMSGELDTRVVETQASAAQRRGAPTVEPTADGTGLLPAAVLVAAVVVLTLVLIRKFRPKIKDEK